MDVTPLVKEGAQIIQSYANGQFRVSGEVYEGPVLVSSDQSKIWNIDASANPEALTENDFEALLEESHNIDVVLFGTGEDMVFLKPEVKKALSKQGLSIECMNTGAACRTYNVLMAEGRRVVAALLPA